MSLRLYFHGCKIQYVSVRGLEIRPDMRRKWRISPAVSISVKDSEQVCAEASWKFSKDIHLTYGGKVKIVNSEYGYQRHMGYSLKFYFLPLLML